MKKEKRILPARKKHLGEGIVTNPEGLKKYKKVNKKKKVIISTIIGVLFLIGGITFYRTFALYEEKKEFNVLKGQVPELPDITLAITLDNQKVEHLPEKGFYLVSVNCDKGTGIWDYESWSIKVQNFDYNTKCNVDFTTASEEEMPTTSKYIVKKATKSIAISLYTGADFDSHTRTYNFDFSDIEGYENFTVDNFGSNIRVQYNYIISGTNQELVRANASIKSYNPSTGIVTVEYLHTSGSDIRLNGRDDSRLYCSCFYISN